MACENECNDCHTVIQNIEDKIDMKLDGSHFYKVLSVDDLFTVFKNNPNKTYVLHGGNTANGNY